MDVQGEPRKAANQEESAPEHLSCRGSEGPVTMLV